MAEISITDHEGIDSATAQIALALRALHPGSNTKYCYRKAERLRDAIMRGAVELAVAKADEEVKAHTPCADCGGGYWQEYAGPPAGDRHIPHDAQLCPGKLV